MRRSTHIDGVGTGRSPFRIPFSRRASSPAAFLPSPVPRPTPRGFTLVELLVVITIISMLMGLLLPAVQSAREAGRKATCLNNIKNVTLAMQNFESGRGYFPGYINKVGSNPNAASWIVTLLPFLEKADMYGLWANGIVSSSVTYYPSPPTITATTYKVPSSYATPPADQSSSIPNNSSAYLPLKSLICPTDNPGSLATNDTPCSYVCNRGINGVDANGNQYGAAYGVCLDQFNTTISTTSGGTTTTTPRTVVRVSGDYISSHDGSSTTLLLAESILTPPGITDVTTNSGQTPFLNLVVQPAGTTCYYRPGSYWTSSFYLATANSAELNLGFEWGPAPTSGYTPPLVTNKITSRHSGGCNVSFCDGHNYFLRDSIDSRVFCQLMTPWGTQAGQTSTYGYVPFNEGSY